MRASGCIAWQPLGQAIRLCALAVAVWPTVIFGQANAGVGRDVGFGRAGLPRSSSVGRLSPIGGFQQVSSNAILQRANQLRGRPQPPTWLGSPSGQTQRTQPSAFRVFTDTATPAASVYRRPSAIMSALTRRRDFTADNPKAQGRASSLVGRSITEGTSAFRPVGTLPWATWQPAKMNYTGATRFGGAGFPVSLPPGLGGGAGQAADDATERPRSTPAPQIAAPSGAATQPVPPGPLTPSSVSGTDIAEAAGTSPAARLEQRFERLMEQGRRQFKNRDYAEAYKSFAVAETLRPHDPEARLGMLAGAYARGQYGLASVLFLSLLNKDPEFLGRAAEIASMYGSSEDQLRHSQAMADFARASGSPPILMLNAFLLWGRGERGRAREIAQTVASAQGAPAEARILRDRMDEAVRAPRGPTTRPAPTGGGAGLLDLLKS